MIIFGDLQVEENEDGKPVTNRKLRFRSDGNILCGARFRNFPAEIDNDVTVFIDTFKNAVLGLYENDEKAVKEAEKEQRSKAEAKAEKANAKEKSAMSADAIKEEIGAVIKSMGKDKTRRNLCALHFEEVLGNMDYRKSDDVDALAKALEYIKTV